MSPYASDAAWYLANNRRRPLDHLADLGVLGPNVSLTHLAHIDRRELDILAQTGTNAIHCPQAACLDGFGLSQVGLYPEMLGRGVNVLFGSDGAAADVLTSGRWMAGLFRDARQDPELIGPGAMLEMATVNAARALGMATAIGSLEVDKKADFVLHDMHRPEWGGAPFDLVTQLALCAPAAGVHSVWIDGVQVVDNGRATLIDEDRLLADARQTGIGLVQRLGLPARTTWPVI